MVYAASPRNYFTAQGFGHHFTMPLQSHYPGRCAFRSALVLQLSRASPVRLPVVNGSPCFGVARSGGSAMESGCGGCGYHSSWPLPNCAIRSAASFCHYRYRCRPRPRHRHRHRPCSRRLYRTLVAVRRVCPSASAGSWAWHFLCGTHDVIDVSVACGRLRLQHDVNC